MTRQSENEGKIEIPQSVKDTLEVGKLLDGIEQASNREQASKLSAKIARGAQAVGLHIDEPVQGIEVNPDNSQAGLAGFKNPSTSRR